MPERDEWAMPQGSGTTGLKDSARADDSPADPQLEGESVAELYDPDWGYLAPPALEVSGLSLLLSTCNKYNGLYSVCSLSGKP
jgi:hypothetical protein